MTKRIIAVFILACLFVPVLAGAEGSAPVPPRKPEVSGPAVPAGLFSGGSVQDFAKSLLGFGAPPASDAVAVQEVAEEEKPVPLKPVEYPDSPVSSSDAKLYKDIFSYQDEGKVEAADRLIAKLHDDRLMGHVLYQRFMHPGYKVRFPELRDWLVLYGDHPHADKVYKLAEARRPEGSKTELAKPVSAEVIGARRDPTVAYGKTYASDRQRTEEQQSAVEAVRKQISVLADDYEPEQALKKLKANASSFDVVEYDQLLAKIASSSLHSGDAARASELAAQSLKRSGDKVPMAGWVAGLAAWERAEYRKAAKAFEVTAKSSYASGWTSAAAAYWAARSHMRAGNVRVVSDWLEAGIKHPRTFYGLIATRSLGRDFQFNWTVPAFTRDHQKTLMETHVGNRAMALVAAGQTQRAESELVRLPLESEEMRNALLAYAGHAVLPSMSMRMASMVSDEGGAYYDSALYPTVPWTPGEGYKIDPALILAITRQESRFNPRAESTSGAVGLMQVLPTTASEIDDEKSLTNPEDNLEVAQQYLENLLKDKSVNGDLVYLLIAYNAGPGNLAKWKKQWPKVKDPLLFVELIPSSETRAYVGRVLANYWIYSLREGQPTPTLDALVMGKPAKYAGLEAGGSYGLASAD